MNFFYGNSHPFADSRRAVVNTWRKNMHCIWLTEDYSRNISIKVLSKYLQWLGVVQPHL